MIKTQKQKNTHQRSLTLSSPQTSRASQLNSQSKKQSKQNSYSGLIIDIGGQKIIKQTINNCGIYTPQKIQNNWRAKIMQQRFNNEKILQISQLNKTKPVNPNPYLKNPPYIPTPHFNQTNYFTKTTQLQKQILNKSQVSLTYRYSHNNSTQAQQYISSSCTKNKERQVEYKIQSQHIESMHKDISDMLNIIKRDKTNKKQRKQSINICQSIHEIIEQDQKILQQNNKYSYISQFQLDNKQKYSQKQKQLQSTINNKLANRHLNFKIAKINPYENQYSYSNSYTQYQLSCIQKIQYSHVSPFIKSRDQLQFQIPSVILSRLNDNREESMHRIGILEEYDKEIYEDYLKKYRELTNAVDHNLDRKQKNNITNIHTTPKKYIYNPQFNYQYYPSKQQSFQSHNPQKSNKSYPTPQLSNISKQLSKYIQMQSIKQVKQDQMGFQQQANSQYVGIIDKQIEKIRQRIYDSEKITKQMENKYLYNKKNYGEDTDDDFRKQILGGSQNINEIVTPRNKTISDRFSNLTIQTYPFNQSANKTCIIKSKANQNMTPKSNTIPGRIVTNSKHLNTINQKLTEIQNKKSLYDKIVGVFANRWAQQIRRDIQLRGWRQQLRDYTLKNSNKKGKNGPDMYIWEILVKKMKYLGFEYGLEQLRQFLQLTSNQCNPFHLNTTNYRIQKSLTQSTNKNYSQSQLVQSLCQSLINSQSYWYTSAISFINMQQAQSCHFNAQVLDLNKKGFVSIQDIVCFINLYGQKFYRNRDIVLLLRRIRRDTGKNVENSTNGNRIQYMEIQEVIFNKQNLNKGRRV